MKMGERDGESERVSPSRRRKRKRARKRCGVAPLLLFSPSAGVALRAYDYSPAAASAVKLRYDRYGYPAVTRTMSPRGLSV
jgi:hypothetical protein